jgi:Holliday junction resolvase-like predicted endonuclease
MSSSVGSIGEEIACAYLLGKKYEVLDRNVFGLPYGEIDIICRSEEGILVFMEVKTATQNFAGFLPEDHATPAKLRRMKVMAQMFSAKHSHLVNDRLGWRIDLIAITLPSEGSPELLTMSNKDVLINHYENVG